MARQYRLLAVSISLYPLNAVLLLSLAVLYKWHILTNGYLVLLFALSPKLDIDNVITLCSAVYGTDLRSQCDKFRLRRGPESTVILNNEQALGHAVLMNR